MFKLNLFLLSLSAKELAQVDRRLDRLAVTEPFIEGAAAKLSTLGRPRTVRVRSRFVYRSQPAPGDVSDRRLPPRQHRPPAARVLSARGIALRFYLIALCAAQMRTVRAGGRPGNDLHLIAGGDDTGWIDLIAVPVETRQSGKYSASRSSKKQRQVVSALRSLSEVDVQLVRLPNAGKKSGKYERFQLCDEGGVRTDGEVPDYFVPKVTEDTFNLPTGLFTNGWIHLLEDTELAFLMMIAHASRSAPGEWIKIPSGLRLLHYGVGWDGYEAHKTLQVFGLLDVHVDENRYEDGKVKNYGKGGQTRLHAFRLRRDGFDEPAAATIKNALGAS